MLDRATFESQIRGMSDRELSEFGVRQIFEQSASIIEIKTLLINHEGRITKLEEHKGRNPGREKKNDNRNNILFWIGAGVAAVIAGVVTALKLIGLIK